MSEIYKNQLITGTNAYKLLYDTIKASIETKNPIVIGKIGSVELRTAIETMFIIQGKNNEYSQGIQYEATYCAGLYPNIKSHFINFMSVYLESVRQINIMASWNDNLLQFEESLWREYGLSLKDKLNTIKQLVDLPALEPFYSTPNYWWQHLYVHKTILIVTPFTKSIQHQLANRDKVWQGRWTNFWPTTINFKFITFPHPYNLLNNIDKQNMPSDSFELLKKYKTELDNIGHFDIALIGAGAYSIPLAVYIKTQLSQTAIHLGGGLQMMFGVAGSRWKGSDSPFFKEYINEYWISPMPEEIPPNYKLQENGCYF